MKEVLEKLHWIIGELSRHHVPQPAPEKAKEPEKMVRFCQIHQRQYTVGPTRMCPECDAACADFTTPVTTGEVLSITVDSLPEPKPTILPPAEIADYAKELGWTPESEVWYDKKVQQFRVYPSGRVLDLRERKVLETQLDRDYCRNAGDTLLPNRTITTESILGTESAAKAVERGVADVVEGRTRQVDSLDQLAAEAQAEGEYGTAWDRWKKLNGFYGNDTHQLFDRFVASECERAVRRAKASSDPNHDPDLDDCDCRSCLREMFEQSKRTIEAMMKSSKPFTPRRSAREVAEDVALQLCRVNDTFTSLSAMRSIPIIQAAIERDREGR